MTMTTKARGERFRQLRSERQQALALGYAGIVERLDGELAELMREHQDASRRNRPFRLLPQSLLIEELRKGVEHYEAHGDFDRAAELRVRLVEIEWPHRLKCSGAVPLIRG